MGTLIAKAYPTILALGFADHTYVECGTGKKAWGCWGGKAGGRVINQGTGSTERADAIAETDERAGVTCYLVNGVCHQAANRILMSAGILVTAARGYWLSSAIFGTYGKRNGGLFCNAPFNQHSNVTGDLSDCASGGADLAPQPASEAVLQHIDALQQLYAQRLESVQTLESELRANLVEFQLEMDFLLPTLSRTARLGMEQAKIKVDLEHHLICEGLSRKEVDPVTFVRAFNDMTDEFQYEAANALAAPEYHKFFGVEADEHIYLPDPQILDKEFGTGTALAVYGPRLFR